MSLDLTEVCERHDITIKRHAGKWSAWDESGAWASFNDSESDAVAALLKARWGITTRKNSWEWLAMQELPQFPTGEEITFDAGRGPSELAAIVALADRLRVAT